MKKFLFNCMLVVATVAMAICFVACSSAKLSPGTYKFESEVLRNGDTVTELKVGDTYMGILNITEDFIVVEINDDGTAKMKVAALGTSGSVDGTWEEDNGKYYLVFEGEKAEVIVNGNRISFEQDGNKMVLVKK